jgi:hypothetical protein
MVFFPIFYGGEKTVRFINADTVGKVYLEEDKLTLSLLDGELIRIKHKVDIDNILELLTNLTGVGSHQFNIHKTIAFEADASEGGKE